MMKCIFMLGLIYYVRYTTSQFTAAGRRQPKALCDNTNKNSVVEHFFNVIFTEFYSTPPVCVCVQMCVGQSTYCYPNGCLKTAITAHEKNETVPNTSEQQPPHQVQKNKNQFMVVKDEKYDFMTDFLEKNYMDDSKLARMEMSNPGQDMRPDPFKDKYNMLGKYRRLPKVELKYNLQEKVKNAKLDSLKLEGVDWSKTRWPMNRQNIGFRQKLYPGSQKPLMSKTNFFAAMLPDNDVAEYPPKYFKRELAKTSEDEANLKSYYILENSLNTTDVNSISLETLIDTLIKTSFGTNVDTTTNSTKVTKDVAETEMKVPIKTVISVNSTGLSNETTRVISMNFTNENVPKNKYVDDANTNKTANLSEMITYLAKKIETQNNTSMEIAKRTVDDFDEITLKSNNDENNSTELNPPTTVENVVKPESTISPTNLDIESTTLEETQVTKKNRQRVARKLMSGKMN